MRTFSPKPLVLALAVAGSHVVYAQSGDSNIDEVVVTGSYAQSLAKALNVKRESTALVDSVMAEDIADFPDQNLAESLQRIPGVAIDRDDGEGRSITVRGLGSTYTRIQVNGMQAQSLAAGSGGVRTDRSFDFNVFASELFNRLDVHKSTSAELEEGSLGATVSLHTGRPFDYDPFTLVGNIQGGYNDQSEDITPRTSGLLSVTNEDKTLGFLISAAYSQKNSTTTGAETVRWEDDTFLCSVCNASELAQVRAAWHPRIPRYADKVNEQDRLGVTTSFQWQIADSTLLSIDGLYADVEVARNEPYLGAISLSRTGATGINQMNVLDYTIDASGTMVAAEIENADVRSENFRADWASEYKQYSLELKHEFSDKFRAKFLAGATDSVLDNREVTVIYEHYSNVDSRKNATYTDSSDTVIWDFTNQSSPLVQYSFDLTNPANWELSEYRDRLYDATSDTSNARLDFEYDLSDALTIKAGVTQKSYGYEILGLRADKVFDGATGADGTDGTTDNAACGIGYAVTANDGAVINAGKQTFFLPDFGRSDTLLNSGCWDYAVWAGDTRKVKEDSLSYYAQVDWDTELFGNRLRGNLGVREAGTDLESTGVTAVNSVATPVTVKHDYSDTLPSLNLAYNLSEDLVLRAAAAKVMSRPDLTDLNPGGSVAIFGDPKVSYGNPFIEPFRADSYDLGLEWYFADDALTGITFFRKDIESFPTSETKDLPWSQVGLPDSLLGSQYEQLKDADFEVSRKINGGGGLIEGVEVQYQQQLSFLPGPDWLHNFGIQTNYTWVDAELDSGRPFQGTSDTSYNFTLYWENEFFQARISNAYRGEYYNSIDSADPHKTRLIDASSTFDFSASYQVNEQLKVTFEALNITDEPKLEYQDEDVKRLVTDAYTGANYFMGMTYSF
ncbi:MAG: hypothetical protein B0W54_11135 [Cellvibrio sp. 79]|nr:MAG: hypothetical protein B0W54_11135 [Cellvibrio sp. 79]